MLVMLIMLLVICQRVKPINPMLHGEILYGGHNSHVSFAVLFLVSIGALAEAEDDGLVYAWYWYVVGIWLI